MKKLMILVAAVVVGLVAHAQPTITDVTAQQRYPWNGKVDISYTVENAGTESRELSVWAVDLSTGVTNVAKNVTGDTAYAGGQHKIVWDMAADGLTLVSTNVVFAVSYKEQVKPEGLYCVIDLSGDTSASSYPVTYLDEVPSGGWSDEYRTTKLVLRKISAGTFTMGSPTGELGRYDNETQHQVTLTKDYYIGVFPVTQRQWELVTGKRPSYFNNNTYYSSRPVEKVSYNMIRGSSKGAGWPNSSEVDATSFLGILQAKSGLALDLPTEAQWEYACRAGTTTALNSGKNLTSTEQDSEMDKVGRYWCNGGSSYSQSCDWSAGTAKVGSYAPNAWGLYDMHGNVWEWCLDWYGSYSGDATDPKGSSSGSYRVLRGGSWSYGAYGCRFAKRGLDGPSYDRNDLGFRLVRTLSNTAIAEPAARSEAAATTSGASEPVRVDLTPGVRTAAVTETLTYSTEWNKEVKGEGEENAVAVVSVNGEVISEQSGSGTVQWKPDSRGTHTLTHTVMLDGEQVGETLTATFLVADLPVPFEVTFVAPNGETSLTRASYATNAVYGRLPEARREGCTFAGWYTSLDGTTRVSAFSPVDPAVKTLYARWVEDEASLYAQWDANKYSVVFDADGGTGEMAAQPFVYDQIQALTANAFKKTGYTFKWWATNEAGEVVYGNGQSVSNLTAEAGFAVALFAKWEKVIDVTEEQIEEWVVYDLAPTFKKPGETAIGYIRRFMARFGDDYVKAFYAETGKIGQDGTALCVYHDYIAGTDPLDLASQFRASITFDASGRPVVTYEPVLSAEKAALRVYTTYGKVKLQDKDWVEIPAGQEADYNFFKVTVEMP